MAALKSPNHALTLSEHIDLKGHNTAVRILRIWTNWSTAAMLMTMAAIPTVVLFVCVSYYLASEKKAPPPPSELALLTACVFAIFLAYAIFRYYVDVLKWSRFFSAGFLVFIASYAYTYFADASAIPGLSEDISAYQVISRLDFTTLPLGVYVIIAGALFVLELLNGVSYYVFKFVNYVPTKIALLLLNVLTGWKGALKLDSDGSIRLALDKRFFVVDKNFRCDGKAAELGVPLFNYAEFHNPAYVLAHLNKLTEELRASHAPMVEKIQRNYPAAAAAAAGTAVAAGAAVASGGAPDMSFEDFSQINPATGLPMIGGLDGVDVMGNPMGTDLHQMSHDHHSFDNHSFNNNHMD